MIITGHKGLVGSHLIKELPGAEGLDIETGQNILTCGLPDSNIVIHLAAHSSVVESVEDPLHDAMVNILGTIRLAKYYQNSRFIFASSGGTIQEKIVSPYGLSKFCAEEYIKLLCKDYVILRFPNLYGSPDSRSVVDLFIKEPTPIIYGDGSQTRDYVHVVDIVEAIKQSMKWPPGTYHVGSGKYHSVSQLAEATGKKVTYSPARKGELLHTPTRNTTPDWVPKQDVIRYIKERI